MSNHKKSDQLSEHEALIEASRKKDRAQAPNKNINQSFIETDGLVPPPTFTPDMFHGLVGEVAKIAASGTEINPVSIALCFMSFLAANFGRNAYLLVSNTYHHPRLYSLHIGRSSRGGKGDSQQITRRIAKRIETIEPDLLGKMHTGGLSSGEGLAALIHDGHKETPAINDKRLFVIEGEFANVINKNKREGNSLSATLRELWDGSDIKPAVKNKSMGVTDPHVGLHACITPAELTKILSKGEVDNGFANRFLMVWGENIGCVAFPEPTEDYLINQLADSTIEIIRFALGNYPDTKNGLQMSLSASAKAFYEKIYRQLKEPLDNELIASLLARRAPYVLRMAMLFALTDKTLVIEACHLKAAFSWVQYSTDTVRFVFYNERKNEQQLEVMGHANKIREFIHNKAGTSSKTDIYRGCFKSNLESEKINQALLYLLSENPASIEQVDRKINTLGKKISVYQKISRANDCQLTSTDAGVNSNNLKKFIVDNKAKNESTSNSHKTTENSQVIFLNKDNEKQENNQETETVNETVL